MSTIFLHEPDDMAWLHEVHSVPADMRCAILTGNEDCPSKIEAWRDPDPAHDAPPDFTFTQTEPTSAQTAPQEEPQ